MLLKSPRCGDPLRILRPGNCFSSFPNAFMALKQTQKKKIIKNSQLHKKDTGSSRVQIHILTKQIKELTGHLQEHKKDHSARRGLLGMVAQRRKLLTHLRMNQPEQYQQLIEELGLKR